MELIIVVAGISAMYAWVIWVRSSIRSELQRAQKAEADRLLSLYLDMKYQADVSDEQKEEWRLSRWD